HVPGPAQQLQGLGEDEAGRVTARRGPGRRARTAGSGAHPARRPRSRSRARTAARHVAGAVSSYMARPGLLRGAPGLLPAAPAAGVVGEAAELPCCLRRASMAGRAVTVMRDE